MAKRCSVLTALGKMHRCITLPTLRPSANAPNTWDLASWKPADKKQSRDVGLAWDSLQWHFKRTLTKKGVFVSFDWDADIGTALMRLRGVGLQEGVPFQRGAGLIHGLHHRLLLRDLSRVGSDERGSLSGGSGRNKYPPPFALLAKKLQTYIMGYLAPRLSFLFGVLVDLLPKKALGRLGSVRYNHG